MNEVRHKSLHAMILCTEYKYRQSDTSVGIIILRTDMVISVTSGNSGYHWGRVGDRKYKGISGMLIIFFIWVLVTQMYSICENTSNIVIMCALWSMFLTLQYKVKQQKNKITLCHTL